MNLWFVAALWLAAVTVALADDSVARIQQQLKDQGFYYGGITGEKNSDTTAAIRRFQIRNGLQITGELNEETIKALAAGESSTANRAVAAAPTPFLTHSPSPVPREDNADLRENADRYVEEAPVRPGDAIEPAPERAPPVYPGRVLPSVSGNFVRTPYENAPPEVQQDVIARAERKLAKRDLYRGALDGIFNSEVEFSLRAYQSRIGLPATGRLDLQTLAALELLPGANQPVFVPRRPFSQPPVRGEWVRP